MAESGRRVLRRTSATSPCAGGGSAGSRSADTGGRAYAAQMPVRSTGSPRSSAACIDASSSRLRVTTRPSRASPRTAGRSSSPKLTPNVASSSTPEPRTGPGPTCASGRRRARRPSWTRPHRRRRREHRARGRWMWKLRGTATRGRAFRSRLADGRSRLGSRRTSRCSRIPICASAKRSPSVGTPRTRPSNPLRSFLASL
jgi:hypothetical protein